MEVHEIVSLDLLLSTWWTLIIERTEQHSPPLKKAPLANKLSFTTWEIKVFM